MGKPRRGRHRRPDQLLTPEASELPWDFAVAEKLQRDVERLLRALPLREGISDVELKIEAHALALMIAQLNAKAARMVTTPAQLLEDLDRAAAALKSAAEALDRLPEPVRELLYPELWSAYQTESGYAAVRLGRLNDDLRRGLPQTREMLWTLAAACARAAQSRVAEDMSEPDQLGDAAAATYHRVTSKAPSRAEIGAFRDLTWGLLELARFTVERESPESCRDGHGHVSPEKVARRAAERFHTRPMP